MLRVKKYWDLKPRNDIPESKVEKIIMRSFPYIKIVVLFVVLGYFLDLGLSHFSGDLWPGMGVVYLVATSWIHEIGHFTTRMFGNFFMEVFCGTLFQIGTPLVMVVYLLVRRKMYLASFVIIWVGYNLFDVAVYMHSGESNVGTIMSGFVPSPKGTSLHDWRTIFNILGVFTKAEYISSVVYNFAIAVFIIGGIVGLYGALKVGYDKLD